MASLNTKTFSQLVQGQAAAIQARAAGLVDFTVGAIPRALAEGWSGAVLWLQGLILVLLTVTRASTSQGADLDSFVADFGAAPQPGDPDQISRLPAQAASGQVIFSRASATQQAIIAIGSTVESQDGSQQYAVTIDATNAAYNAALNGYVLAAETTTLTVPVQAITAGTAGNAVAGAINTITSAIPGVDTVTNPVAFANGFDAEADAAFRVRFRQFIHALREATPPALQFAITSLQRGVTCNIIENQQRDGAARTAYFYAVVDDGTGNPPGSLLTAAGLALDSSHASGIEFSVYAPVVLPVNVSALLVTAASANHAIAVATASAALQAYLNSVPIGGTVYWSRIWQVLQDASADILEVTNLSLNGGSADIPTAVYQVAKAGTLTLS